jgi:hypothetical protein
MAHQMSVASVRKAGTGLAILLGLGLTLGLVGAANAFQISGDVKRTDLTGAGIKGVKIIAAKKTGQRPVGTAVTDDNGHYVIGQLPAGSYFVYAFDRPARSEHRVFKEPETNRNPASTIISDTNVVVNFTSRGLDNASPSIQILQPAASSSETDTVPPPTLASGVATDVGDDTDGDNTPDRRAAGVGQVVVSIVKDIDFSTLNAKGFNFVTRRFEDINVSNLLSSGFSTINAQTVKFAVVASRSGDNWSTPLPTTDRDGNPVFASGVTYYIGANAYDKAGNGGLAFNAIVIE